MDRDRQRFKIITGSGAQRAFLRMVKKTSDFAKCERSYLSLRYTDRFLHACYKPAHLILLDFITRTILSEEYRSLSSSLYNFLHSPVPPSLLGPNILLDTLFSSTLSLCSSLNVNDQVSHPYKTTGKIVVQYILIFKFLDSKLEDKTICTEW